MNPDPLYTDDEPWPYDLTEGAVIYTGAWITAALLVAGALVLTLIVRRFLR